MPLFHLKPVIKNVLFSANELFFFCTGTILNIPFIVTVRQPC